MKLEIVEFYKFAQHPDLKHVITQLFGTMHVFIIDYNLDVRGIKVYKKSVNSLFFTMPCEIFYDPIEKKNVKFPVLSFMKEDDKLYFSNFLKTEGKKYILEKESEFKRAHLKNKIYKTDAFKEPTYPKKSYLSATANFIKKTS